jgi:hypothetical protein
MSDSEEALMPNDLHANYTFELLYDVIAHEALSSRAPWAVWLVAQVPWPEDFHTGTSVEDFRIAYAGFTKTQAGLRGIQNPPPLNSRFWKDW